MGGGLRQTLAPSPDRAESWIAPMSMRWVWRLAGMEAGGVCVYTGECMEKSIACLTSCLLTLAFLASCLTEGSAVYILTKQATLPPLLCPAGFERGSGHAFPAAVLRRVSTITTTTPLPSPPLQLFTV